MKVKWKHGRKKDRLEYHSILLQILEGFIIPWLHLHLNLRSGRWEKKYNKQIYLFLLALKTLRVESRKYTKPH
jgi:hypothetical protein